MHWLLTSVTTCLLLQFDITFCIVTASGSGKGHEDPSELKATHKLNPLFKPSNHVGFFDACMLNIKEMMKKSNKELDSQSACESMSVSVAYRTCAQLHHVDLETEVFNRGRISGQGVISVFQEFCGKRNTIHSCVQEHLQSHNCQDSDVENFKKAVAVGEYYCEGKYVKPFISDIYQDIPAVGTTPSKDQCMKIAYRRYTTCLMPQLLMAVLHTERDAVDLDWKLENMLCVLKVFQGNKECPMKEALLTTTLIHGKLLVPPAYGLNVTQYIVGLDDYVQQQRRRTGSKTRKPDQLL